MIKVTSWSNYKEIYCRTKHFKKPGLRVLLYVLLQKILEDYVEVKECQHAGSVTKKKILKIKKSGKVSRRQNQNAVQPTTHIG